LWATDARDDPPGETATDYNDGGNDEGEEEEKEKGDSVVSNWSSWLSGGERYWQKEEYVKLLNGIQMDVKRLWEGPLFYHVVTNSANSISVKPKLIL